MFVFGAFLVRVFPHSDGIRRDTSVSQYSDEKIRTRKTPNTNTFHAVTGGNDPFIQLQHRTRRVDGVSKAMSEFMCSLR